MCLMFLITDIRFFQELISEVGERMRRAWVFSILNHWYQWSYNLVPSARGAWAWVFMRRARFICILLSLVPTYLDFLDLWMMQWFALQARSDQLELAQGVMFSPNANPDARVPSEDELKHCLEILSKEIEVLCKVMTAWKVPSTVSSLKTIIVRALFSRSWACVMAFMHASIFKCFYLFN